MIFIIIFVLIYRYECTAGCLDATGKVVGTVYYEMVSTQIDASPKLCCLIGWVQYYASSQLCVLTKVSLDKTSKRHLLTGVLTKDLQCRCHEGSFLQQSSVCRAGLHAGVIDNDGGWMDVTRQGRKDFFIKSNKNGVHSLG